MIPSGALPRRAALTGARISAVLAVAAMVGIALISWPAALAGLVALALAWGYSIPPLRLLDTGWGELITSIVVAGLVPLTGVWSQGVAATPRLWWTITALVPLHLAMMLCFELPDLDSDAAAGKRVLAVRMGQPGVVALIGGCLASTGILLGLAAWLDGDPSHRIGAFGAVAATALAVAAGIRRQSWFAVTTSAVIALVTVAGTLLVGT